MPDVVDDPVGAAWLMRHYGIALPGRLRVTSRIGGRRMTQTDGVVSRETWVEAMWPARMEGLFEGVEHEGRMRGSARPPTDDTPREDVDHEGDVDETRPHPPDRVTQVHVTTHPGRRRRSYRPHARPASSTAAANLFVVLLVMAPSSQELEPPANPARFFMTGGRMM